MKVKHIIISHFLIAGILLVGLLSGCIEKGSQAAWEAGKLYMKDPAGDVCRHRVAIVAKNMMERGETFDLVFGKPKRGKGSRHVWIEQYLPSGGILIIEPTQRDSSPQHYEEDDRLHYTPESDANIAVISHVNRWLKEKDRELFHPIAN